MLQKCVNNSIYNKVCLIHNSVYCFQYSRLSSFSSFCLPSTFEVSADFDSFCHKMVKVSHSRSGSAGVGREWGD